MALEGQQRALLQLLCERSQGYGDIAELLGSSLDDVRGQAREALAELGGADPDAEVGLTDYLLGQADPIGRADAVRFLQADPQAHELATRIEAALLEIAPAAKLPKLPEPRGKARRAAVPAPGDARAEDASVAGGGSRIEAGSGRSGVAALTGDRQTRLIAAIAGAGVIILFVVLAVAGVFSGGDDSESTPAAASDGTSATTADGTATPETTNVTEVDLEATGGSGVAGTAAFGIVDQSQLYVELELDGLDPEAARDSAYFFWLMLGDAGGYPLNTPLTPDQNGRFSGRIAVPPAVASTVAGQAELVKVSLTPVRDLAREAREAAEEQVPIVPFTGTDLASGKIPLAAPAEG